MYSVSPADSFLFISNSFFCASVLTRTVEVVSVVP